MKNKKIILVSISWPYNVHNIEQCLNFQHGIPSSTCHDVSVNCHGMKSQYLHTVNNNNCFSVQDACSTSEILRL